MAMWPSVGRALAPATLQRLSTLVCLFVVTTASKRQLFQQDDLSVAPVVIDESSCATFTADEYNPLVNANGSIMGFMTVRSSGATSVSQEELLEVSIQLRESSGLYFAKAPSADAAGNVVAVTTRFLPDACPMVTHAISSEAATADCAGRKTKLDFAVPLELFNCSAYVLDDFFRGFFVQLRVYVATEPCAPPTSVIYAGPPVNALDGQQGCTYAAITGGCKPSTCLGWNTDLAALQAAQLAATKGTPAEQPVAPTSQKEQWKTIVPAVVGAAVDALQPHGHYDEDLMASPGPRGMDLNDEELLKAERRSAAPYDYDSEAEGGNGRLDSTLMSPATHARTLGLSGGSQIFWGLSGHWLRSPRFGGLGASGTGGEMTRLRPHGGLDSAAASPTVPSSPGVHFVRMRAHGRDDTVSRSAALLPRPHRRPSMAAGATAAAAQSGVASPEMGGTSGAGGLGYGGPYYPGGAATNAARTVSTAPNSPGMAAFDGGSAARAAAVARAAAASMAAYSAANAGGLRGSQWDRRERAAHGELVSEHSPPIRRHGSVVESGMGSAAAHGGTSRLAHETRPSPYAAPHGAAAAGRGVYLDSYNSPQMHSRSAADAAAGTALAVSAGCIQGSPPHQAAHDAPSGPVSTSASITTAPYSPPGLPTGGGDYGSSCLGAGPSPAPSSTGGRYAAHPRAAGAPGGGAVEMAGRQRAATDTGEGLLMSRQPREARTSASGVPTGGARGAWTALWGGGGASAGTTASGGGSTGWALPPSSNASTEPQVQVTVESAATAAAPPSPNRSRWLARAPPPSRLGRVQQPLEPAAGVVYGRSITGSPDRLVAATEPQVAVVLDGEEGGRAGNSTNSSGVRGRMAAALRARSSRNGGFEAPPRRSAPGMGTLDELGTAAPTVAISLHGPEGPNSTGGGGGLLSHIARVVSGIRQPALGQSESGLNAGANAGSTGAAAGTGTVRGLFGRSPQSSEEEKQA
eukprot:XP_001691893.1 predicted protein [Chlamydomonas reinhardtii]